MRFNFSKTLRIKDPIKCCEKRYNELVSEFRETLDKFSNDIKGLKDKTSNILEADKDKFITEITYEREGNNVILKYIYSNGEEKTVTLEDKDTIGVLYDDTAVRGLINANTELITELRGKVTALETENTSLKEQFAQLVGRVAALEADNAFGEWAPVAEN